MKFYFAYGSNMKTDQMVERCPNHRVCGLGMLNGYRWIISSRGFANIVKSKGDHVYGVVYSISPEDELMLDKCEGVSSGSYRKENTNIRTNDKFVSCLVYIDSVITEGVPKSEYVTRINIGIRDAQLPLEYVERVIRRFVPG